MDVMFLGRWVETGSLAFARLFERSILKKSSFHSSILNVDMQRENNNIFLGIREEESTNSKVISTTESLSDEKQK